MTDAWSPMSAVDLAMVVAISDAVHGSYTERREIYAERLALYPAGCFALHYAGDMAGYLVSHPWHRDAPPALNMPIGMIPVDADTYYLHDLALLPAARGTGASVAAVELVVEQAISAGFGEVTLMAVNGADRFWAKQGFAPVQSVRAASYGDEACLMRRPV